MYKNFFTTLAALILSTFGDDSNPSKRYGSEVKGRTYWQPQVWRGIWINYKHKLPRDYTLTAFEVYLHNGIEKTMPIAFQIWQRLNVGTNRYKLVFEMTKTLPVSAGYHRFDVSENFELPKDSYIGWTYGDNFDPISFDIREGFPSTFIYNYARQNSPQFPARNSIRQFPGWFANREHSVAVMARKPPHIRECLERNDPTGRRYQGTARVTRTQKPCIRWDDARIHFYDPKVRETMHNIDNFSDRRRDHNYCRNPDADSKGVWCYLSAARTETAFREGVRFDYCSVPECPQDPLSRSTRLSTTALQVAFSTSTLLFGPQPTPTASLGQPTDSSELSRGNTGTGSLPMDGHAVDANGLYINVNKNSLCTEIAGKINGIQWHYLGSTYSFRCAAYCNPGHTGVKGCLIYSHDSSICKAAIQSGIQMGNPFRIKVSKTSYAAGCTANGISSNTFGDGIRSRNAFTIESEASSLAARSTTVETTTPASYQSTTPTILECLSEPKGVTYIGRMNKASDGQYCVKWNDPRIYFKTEMERVQFTTSSRFHDQTTDHNYCRNPDNDANGPWCYLNGAFLYDTHGKGVRWQYCHIPRCQTNSILPEDERGVASAAAKNPPLLYPFGVNTDCGKRPYNNVRETRIVGGTISRQGEWPWLVRLWSRYLCGSTLINNQWLVTAAHCFYTDEEQFFGAPRNWWATVGEWDTWSRDTYSKTISVSKIILHPHHDLHKDSDDIALVKLAEPITLNDFVNVPCLPTTSPIFEPGKRCYVAGWGHKTYSGQRSRFTMHVGLQIISNRRCAELNGKNILNQMMCAYDSRGGRDSCQGDSGGPLMCYEPTKNQWLVTGIISHGKGCGHPDYPGVYMRISAYMDWMAKMIIDNT